MWIMSFCGSNKTLFSLWIAYTPCENRLWVLPCSKLYVPSMSIKRSGVAAVISDYILCPLGLSSSGREHAVIHQPQPKATIPGHLLKDYFFPLASSTTASFPYLRAQSELEQRSDFILILIICHNVTQVRALKTAFRALWVFFIFNYYNQNP